MAMNGKFITLEGIDGAGKSSHIEFIAQRIRRRGFEVLTTREPGGTDLGEKLRTLLLHETMHAETEVLLMFASRREQLAQVIEPLLARGAWVVCDRFTDSTYAYQCGGRGLPAERVAAIEQWVHGHLQPDLTFLFDAPLEVARERLDRGTPDPDKFERERGEFFARVRANYLARAEAHAGRIKVIDSGRSLDVIQAELAALVDGL
jgi:dTMP kinase